MNFRVRFLSLKPGLPATYQWGEPQHINQYLHHNCLICKTMILLVLVSYCCVTNCPKYSDLKQHTFVASQFLRSGICSAGYHCLKVSHRPQLWGQPGLQSHLKAEGGSIFKLTCMVLAGLCSLRAEGFSSLLAFDWRPPSVPSHMGLSPQGSSKHSSCFHQSEQAMGGKRGQAR